MSFENNSEKAKSKIKEIGIAWLYDTAGLIQMQAQKNSRVDSGQTKGSFEYSVDSGAEKAAVGSNYENTIWEEFGTGQYALEGNGRKTPWVYKDRNGNWHKTSGKRGTRALFNAFKTLEKHAQQALKEKLKGL